MGLTVPININSNIDKFRIINISEIFKLNPDKLGTIKAQEKDCFLFIMGIYKESITNFNINFELRVLEQDDAFYLKYSTNNINTPCIVNLEKGKYYKYSLTNTGSEDSLNVEFNAFILIP